jgi:hypothetical protein
MNLLLSVVDQITNNPNQHIACGFVHLSRDLANALLDHFAHFTAAAQITKPRILWTTLAENSCRFLKHSDRAPPLLNEWLAKLTNGYAILPDVLDPQSAGSPLAGLVMDGLDPHAIINEDGISWGLLVNDRPLGTLTVPTTLLEVAAGIKLPDGLIPTNSV